MKFTYFAPTKVYFGEIDFDSLCLEIEHFGKNVLFISGGNYTTKIAKQIIYSINSKYKIELFNGITSNPLATTIENIARKAIKPDVIISVGGGSVHDSAKALAILMTHEGYTEQYTTDGEFSVPGITRKTIPIITIPTISGSGAEVSPAALIRVEDKKRVIFSPYIYPKATFINPQYASTIKKELFIKTSLDALVQGVESYVSTSAQDFSKRYSLSAIERVIKSLINFDLPNNSNYSLQQIALASIESLYAVGQSTVGAVHAISDPLSGIFDIHHGEAVAFLLPYVVDVNYQYAKKQYDEIKSIFDNYLGHISKSLNESIFNFYKRIGFDYNAVANRLKAYNIHKYIKQCVEDSYNNDMVGNPRILNDTLIEEILNSALR